ncbi:hypothetical protein AAFM46_13040 [Arthrobacter sp. TMP15]|uniref:hypothetical protein n=1 Tax=Arthrobacter sp. TMP15 TaxID=3140789 RepID=UPI0031BA3363
MNVPVNFPGKQNPVQGLPVENPQQGTSRFSFPAPRRLAVISAAVGAGVGAGLLGTSLHGHAWFPDGPHSAIPYGAVLALLLLAAVSLFVGLWSKSSWIVICCGGAAYATAGLLSLQLGSFGMIFNNTQGSVWLYGIAVVTPLVAWLTWILIRGGTTRR